MALKPQDVVVSLKVALSVGRWKFADLARELGLSASEVHQATRRLLASQLVVRRAELDMLVVQRRNLLEFLIHGLRYVFPIEAGPIVRGVPTGASSPVLRDHFTPTDAPPLVWPYAEGSTRGQSIAPLYPRVPEAALRDPNLYAVLAISDALRSPSSRERAVGADVLVALLERA